MADFILLAAQQLRAAVEPFRCDTFGCETAETDALDKACAEVDRVMDAGLLEAAKKSRESALAAAVQAEREAILSRLESMKSAALAHGVPDAIGLGLACGVVKGRGTVTPSISPTIPTVGEWKTDRVGNWRFFVGDKCLASISKNVCRWFTFSPIGGVGEGGYVYEIEAAKRQAVAALVRQGWYRETEPAVDVLAVVREWAAAREEHRKAHTLETPVFDEARRKKVLAANERMEAATARLLALVAPRTAEESSGVET